MNEADDDRDDLSSTPPRDDTPRHLQKTQLGIEVCYVAPLAYLFVWLSGLALLVLEPRDPYVRFHAAQSVVVFGGLTVLNTGLTFLPFIGWLRVPIAGLVTIGLWVLLMYRAWEDSRSGVPYRLPIAADVADRLLELWGR